MRFAEDNTSVGAKANVVVASSYDVIGSPHQASGNEVRVCVYV